MSLLKLFLIFVKIGAILLGGGYVILPIMQNEFAEKRELVSKDELTDYFALAQSVPGIIAANMTMFIGYKLRGIPGAIAAMFGVIFVPFCAIVLLASVLNMFVNNSFVQSAMWGVGIAVIALILLTIREMWQKSHRDLFFYIIFSGALCALTVFKLSPIQTILIFVFTGILFKTIHKQEVNK